MTKDEQTIANLKKLKSVHNGSYGADIDQAIKAMEQKSVLDKIRADIEELVIGGGARGCGQSIRYGLSIALEIIDKYREGEKQNETDN